MGIVPSDPTSVSHFQLEIKMRGDDVHRRAKGNYNFGLDTTRNLLNIFFFLKAFDPDNVM